MKGRKGEKGVEDKERKKKKTHGTLQEKQPEGQKTPGSRANTVMQVTQKHSILWT